ncbi:hypothetical protein T492DRAFT_1076717 [Pavlovales sp. CCMP2436]|nr:hypothetical protein T492DRAFT_1076717 [Pavlovales sp. CCMP2436]
MTTRRSARSRLEYPPAVGDSENGQGGPAQGGIENATLSKLAKLRAELQVELDKLRRDHPESSRSPFGSTNGRGLSPDCASSASGAASPAAPPTRPGAEGRSILAAQRRRMETDTMFNYDDAHRPPPVLTPLDSPSPRAFPVRSDYGQQQRSSPPATLAQPRPPVSPLQREIDRATICALREVSPAVAHEFEFPPTEEEEEEGDNSGEEATSEVDVCSLPSASSIPAEAPSSQRVTPSTADTRKVGAGALLRAQYESEGGEEGAGPALLGEHSILLEGWVTKYSDMLGIPRRRWLVVCGYSVFAFAHAHGYLQGPVQHTARRPDESQVAGIGGHPTMALDLRKCAVLALDDTADELVVIPLRGERKRIRVGARSLRYIHVYIVYMMNSPCALKLNLR